MSVRIIESKHWSKVCRIGRGAETCKYLSLGKEGFECMKDFAVSKKIIDTYFDKDQKVAQGDNCDGYFSSLIAHCPKTITLYPKKSKK